MSYLIDLHLEDCRAGDMSPHTLAKRENVLRRLHDALPAGVAYAATEHLTHFMAIAGWSRATRCTYDNHVRQFYAWATAAGYLDGDPSIGMRRPKPARHVPNPASDDDLAAALQAASPLDTVVLLAAYQGLRVSEIARCRREHLTEKTLRVPIGKGGDPDTVPTHPLVWELLRDHPAGTRADPTAGLFVVDRHGGPVTGHWITQLARRRFDRIGLDHLHVHMFRHWGGTTVQRAQGNIRVTQKFLRHKRVTSTEGYTFVSDDEVASAVTALPTPRKATGPAEL